MNNKIITLKKTAHFLAVMLLLIFLASCAFSENADWKNIPPEKSELTILPLDKNLPGKPPESGIRYWSAPFKELDIVNACYNAIRINHDKNGSPGYELWYNTWEGRHAADHKIVVRRGPSLDRLGPPETICDSAVITDTPDLKDPAKLSAYRGFSRFSTILHDQDAGYIILCCVCADYLPGSTSLFPALLVSKTGNPGSFRYLGKIKGEPAAMNAKKKIWCDGGALIRLKNGKWRMYLNGFGPALAALESDTLDGEWKFIRDEKGQLRDLTADALAGTGRKGCFYQVLKVDDNNWHMWMTDKWPPQSIWHFQSEDGLGWELYGHQSEITRKAFNNHGIKCLRAFIPNDKKGIAGLLSIYKEDTGWVLHESRIPSSSQSATD